LWDDADANLTRLEEWSHAAHYALAHYLPDEFRAELGMRVVRVTDAQPKVREVADDWMPEETDWPDPIRNPRPERQRRREQNGPDIDF
jgi:hypothetical protein